MDRAKFYAALRKRNSGVFGTSLSQSQVAGIEAVLDEAEKRRTPLKWLAYMFATDYHEVGRTMQPVREGFKATDAEARAYVRRHYPTKYGKPVGPYGHYYYGRGLVQLTWLSNYEKASKKLGVDFVRTPDLVMQTEHAVQIMFQGMEEGWFTGKRLSDYTDYVSMRRIINGTDKASLIAGYAVAFETALRDAGYGQWVGPKPTVPDIVHEVPPIPKPTPAPKMKWFALLWDLIRAYFAKEK